MAATTLINALLKKRISFLVFSLVGATTAGIYFVSLAVLLEKFAVDYRVAVTISYLLGVTFHFSANKLLTFKNNELMGTIPQLFRYAAVAVFNYVLTMLIVLFTVERLRQPPYLGVFISVGITAVSGYLLSKHWIFAHAEKRK